MRRPCTTSCAALASVVMLSGCAGRTTPPDPATDVRVAYADWNSDEPPYRLYPGDEVRITPVSAPELSRTAPVLPDGRVSLPLVPPVMVADRTVEEAAAAVAAAYRSVLRRPDVTVEIQRTAPIRVFVGGNVIHPGVLEIPGDVDALQAVITAGGFGADAARDRVILVRRDRSGALVRRIIDLAAVLREPRSADATPLRRFDVLYVPRSGDARP